MAAVLSRLLLMIVITVDRLAIYYNIRIRHLPKGRRLTGNSDAELTGQGFQVPHLHLNAFGDGQSAGGCHSGSIMDLCYCAIDRLDRTAVNKGSVPLAGLYLGLGNSIAVYIHNGDNRVIVANVIPIRIAHIEVAGLQHKVKADLAVSSVHSQTEGIVALVGYRDSAVVAGNQSPLCLQNSIVLDLCRSFYQISFQHPAAEGIEGLYRCGQFAVGSTCSGPVYLSIRSHLHSARHTFHAEVIKICSIAFIQNDPDAGYISNDHTCRVIKGHFHYRPACLTGSHGYRGSFLVAGQENHLESADTCVNAKSVDQQLFCAAEIYRGSKVQSNTLRAGHSQCPGRITLDDQTLQASLGFFCQLIQKVTGIHQFTVQIFQIVIFDNAVSVHIIIDAGFQHAAFQGGSKLLDRCIGMLVSNILTVRYGKGSNCHTGHYCHCQHYSQQG